MRFILLVYFCTVFSSQADLLIESKNLSSLATDQQWLSLLHITEVGQESEIDDPKFFLSNTSSAKEELLATIQQLQSYPELRCKFPARYEWLSEKLNWTFQPLNPQNCPELFEWYQQLDTHKASLIFPTAYMNSPSSMFGHLFLRLDADKTANDLLAFSVNYGANVDNDDSSLTYIYKGLFGGYPGTYTIVPYYEKVNEYNDIEHRDIWEYPLKLDDAQLRRLLLHLWELQNVEIDYYFIDENCAYRILSLLAVAYPNLNLMKDFQTRAIPADVLKASVKHHLVEAPNYRPSLSTQLLSQYSKLNEIEQAWTLKITSDNSELESNDFLRLPELSRAKVYETLNLWLRYELSDAGENTSEASLGYRLLRARSQLNVQTLADNHAAYLPPDLGHDAYRFGVGYQHQANQNTLLFSTRFAYHDLIDSTEGYLSGAQIEFFNIELSVANTTRVNLANILSLKSLSPQNDLMSPLSWSFDLAGERFFRSEDTSVFGQYIAGKVGTTFGNDDNMFYSLIGLKFLNFSHERDQPGTLATFNFGWRTEVNSGQFLLNLEHGYDIDASNIELSKINVGYQFNWTNQSAIRFEGSRKAFNDFYNSEVKLSYLFYL
ncbi:MAG: DUF4105 domain-containing protein [Gammaproteobacteria bacterium]|nr:DUF4105 domain-containing protein [Gammaproteobacteria bacterium]